MMKIRHHHVLVNEVLEGINGLATECRKIAKEIGLEDLMLFHYSKKDIKEAVKAAVKKEFLSEMQSKVKVSDRLSDDPEDNSYINYMSLTRARVWIRIRARAIAGVKGNFRHSYVNDMACRFCAQGSEKLKNIYSFVDEQVLRGGDWMYLTRLLDFWRRMKMKLAAVT